MPFGLSSAPGVFQSLMSEVLEGLDFAIPYLDDIVLYSASIEAHLDHLEIVFNRLRQHKLKLKLKKCHFFQIETKYLGFQISPAGISPDPAKVQGIQDIPVPKSATDVRALIGTCGYYRRFVPDFAKVSKPLIALTKKYAQFNWTGECQQAFECLKKRLADAPLLGYPELNRPYHLYADASDKCVDALLAQVREDGTEYPIYFLSHKLNPTQAKYATIERECYSVFYALQKLDVYLRGAKVKVFTDHKPLTSLLTAPMKNKRLERWSLAISEYDIEIHHIPGKMNVVADTLSRQYQESGHVSDSISETDIPGITVRKKILLTFTRVLIVRQNRKYRMSRWEP